MRRGQQGTSPGPERGGGGRRPSREASELCAGGVQPTAKPPDDNTRPLPAFICPRPRGTQWLEPSGVHESSAGTWPLEQALSPQSTARATAVIMGRLLLSEPVPDGPAPSPTHSLSKGNLPVYIPKLSWVMDEGPAGHLTRLLTWMGVSAASF